MQYNFIHDKCDRQNIWLDRVNSPINIPCSKKDFYLIVTIMLTNFQLPLEIIRVLDQIIMYCHLF
jgi:hypothetical protein